MTHHVLKLFEQRAELLHIAGCSWDLDDAASELAAWLDLARYKLTESDVNALTNVGALLYREGLRKRAG
jgi:hypothetical protein